MSGLLIGYARVSTEEQDLTAHRNGLAELGVDGERVYVDHGLTGTIVTARVCVRPSRPAGPVTPWS